MKKIICLFLMATILTLASSPAIAWSETGHTATVQLSDASLAEITGGLPLWACVTIVGASAFSGAQFGAAIGTFFGPGGTAVGGIIGGAVVAAGAAYACL